MQQPPVKYWATLIVDRLDDARSFEYVQPARSKQDAAAYAWRAYSGPGRWVGETRLYHGGSWPNVTPA